MPPSWLEFPFDGGEARRRHVADHLDADFKTTFIGFNERARLGMALPTLAGNREGHRLAGPVQVDEDDDIVVPTLERGFIQIDGLGAFKFSAAKALDT
jgi:hypothetical protein